MAMPQVDDLQKALQFVSISSDGDVTMWTLSKCELQPERLAQLMSERVPPEAAANGEAAEVLTRHSVGGTCMDFNKVRDVLRCIVVCHGLPSLLVPSSIQVACH